MRLAFCAIVKATDEEAVLLDRLLENVSPHVDGLFITITGKNKKCTDVANKYGANVSYFKWVNDFSAARNFNFSQVPKDYNYILWADADDVFKGLEKLKPTIEEYPHVDAFHMNYIYWFDENNMPDVVHGKTQVVKNDGCVEWAGALHEDFKENRQLTTYFVEGITRLHLTDMKRVEVARDRNVEIARLGTENNPDDPRVWWNYANSLRSAGEPEKAIESFNKFLKNSRSETEKYIARLRMAEIYGYELGDFVKAMDMVNYAIGIQPEFPDGYYAKARILTRINKFEEARDYYQMGLVKKPPYHSVIVWNPREYDFKPLMELANVYVSLSMPQLALECIKACRKILPDDPNLKNIVKQLEPEAKKVEKVLEKAGKLKDIKDDNEFLKEFNKIPADLRMHPMLTHMKNVRIQKKKTSGKDLVIYCSFTKHEWTPKTAIEEGVGGSEEAVIHLAKGLVKRGWRVEVYNNCGHKELKFDGVVYKPFWSWNPRDKQDVLILWRHPKSLDYEINADKIYVDMHDALMPGEFTDKRLEKVDRIFVKSRAQRILYPDVPDNKFAIIPNGVDLSLFDQEVERDPYTLVNFSSADRSLETLLEVLPEIKKRLPKKIADKVRFKWFYGWGVFDSSYTAESEQAWKKKLIDKLEQYKSEGWAEGGYKINHKQVAWENLHAGAMVYPTEFYEIDFIGGTKAQIAGCVPITSDFAALGDKIKYGVKIHSDKTIENWTSGINLNYGFKEKDKKEEFIKAVVNYLKHPEKWDKDRIKMSKWARDKYNWDTIVDQWDKVLNGGAN